MPERNLEGIGQRGCELVGDYERHYKRFRYGNPRLEKTAFVLIYVITETVERLEGLGPATLKWTTGVGGVR